MARRWLNSVDVEVSGGGALAVMGILPTAETDLPVVELDDASVRTIALPAGAIILLLQGDGPFVEGQTPPDPVLAPVREAGTIWSIPCRGRSAWHLRRTDQQTVRVRIRILLEA